MGGRTGDAIEDQKPKSKQELVKALQSAPIRSFDIYEGSDLDRLPSKSDFVRQAAAVIIIRT
jgi:hypothetical protein